MTAGIVRVLVTEHPATKLPNISTLHSSILPQAARATYSFCRLYNTLFQFRSDDPYNQYLGLVRTLCSSKHAQPFLTRIEI